MSAPAIAALRYAGVRDYLAPRIEAYKFRPKPVYLPLYEPNDVKAPVPFIVLMVGGGAGLHHEALYDRPFITLRVIGRSQDYDGAEELALTCDAELCALSSTTMLGDIQVNFITRTGGRPQLLLRDSAERYHFTSSYLADAESGI